MKDEEIRKTRVAKLFLYIIGLISALTLSGCITLPWPRSARSARPDLLTFLVDGRTTRETVLATLSQPSGQFESGRILTYRLGYERKNRGYYLADREAISSGTFTWMLTRFNLVLVFNDAGVLRRHSLVEIYAGRSSPSGAGVVQPDFLCEGKTTREDVITQLGQPTGRFESDRILTYRLGSDSKSKCYVRVEREATLSGWPTWVRARFSLVLVFDEGGILRKQSLVEVNDAEAGGTDHPLPLTEEVV